MNKKTLKLLAISAFLLIEREALIPFYEEAGAKLTSDEDDYLRFDLDGGHSLIIKYNKDNSVKLVTAFFPNGDECFKAEDQIIKIYIEYYEAGIYALNDFPSVTSSETALVLCEDDIFISHIEKDAKAGFILSIADVRIALKIREEEICDLTKLINDCLPELNQLQRKAVKKIVDDQVHQEKRRCHRIMQDATISLLDEK